MKWRNVKKQFKKKKPGFLGLMICAEDKKGNRIYGKITNVFIKPAGGNKVRYDVEAKSCSPIMPTSATKKDGLAANLVSYELNVDLDTKQANLIKDLINQ